ncbi:hypothetical protein ACFL27_06865 [candidate division CSSED10-310 bacterium]|uniref:CHASE2 domain-containing protein n=1 Tax=candidate division CSSED10-310 bacterium TaxID=2855610 RepID=A0ABV6YUR2_UNCC1
MTLVQRLQHFDRRIIFIFVALGTMIPIIWPFGFSISVTDPVRQVFQRVDKMTPGSVLLLSFDFDPAAAPELAPMAKAVMRHCAAKDIKIVGLSYLLTGGAEMAESIMSELGRELNLVYGVDYVNLGFKSGAPAPMILLANDLHGVFPLDNRGTNLKDLPLMQKIHSYDDIDFIVELASTILGDYWINVVNARFGEEMAIGTTAVSAPKYYAFLDSGQLIGLMGGLKGAAEYEQLINYPGTASRGMDAQRIVHLMIIVFVIMGNIIYFIEKKQKRMGLLDA